MIILTLEEIEIMLLGGTVFKDDVSINVSRETVDFYKREKQLQEIEKQLKVSNQDECFKELINRNRGIDFNYFIRVTTDFLTYDVNIVLTDYNNVLIDYETIKTFKSTELDEMKKLIDNLKTIYVVEDEMHTIDTKNRYWVSGL